MKKLVAILLLFVATAAHARIEHAGIILQESEEWPTLVLSRSIRPYRYKITNNAIAQTIVVRFESEGLVIQRSHRLTAGESVNSCLYFPTGNNPRYSQLYGHISISGSESGASPPHQGMHFHMDSWHDPSVMAPTVLLVGQGYDITGLTGSLEDFYSRSYRARGMYRPGSHYYRISAAGIPASWVGLSGISIILITQAEAEQLSAESKTALQDYVLSGGYVALISADHHWSAHWWGQNGAVNLTNDFFMAQYGLGTIQQARQGPANRAEWDRFFGNVQSLWSVHSKDGIIRRSNARMPVWSSITQQMDGLPMERPEVTSVSYMGLWWIMVGFAVLVGPVNYGWLRKRGKLHLFILTAPLISLASGALLLAVFTWLEGFHSRSIVSGITFLFQDDHRAISFHRASVYSTTALPLQYPSDTIVQPQFGSDFPSANSDEHNGAMDLTDGVKLTGFVPPRLLRAFGSIRIKPERGRLVVEQRDGQWQAQNGLGMDVEEFLYRAPTGSYYTGGRVRNGETMTLKPIHDAEATTVQNRLNMFTDKSRIPNISSLARSSYLAVTDGAFGWESPNQRLETKVSRHILYGFIRHE